MTAPTLVVQNLHHTYFPGTPNEQRALHGVDLTMEERDFVIVIGQSKLSKLVSLRQSTMKSIASPPRMSMPAMTVCTSL